MTAQVDPVVALVRRAGLAGFKASTVEPSAPTNAKRGAANADSAEPILALIRMAKLPGFRSGAGR
jgi:hypothetical protein